MSSWVVRIAKQRRVCDNCEGWIQVEERYWLTVAGDKWCCACPPDDTEEMCQ